MASFEERVTTALKEAAPAVAEAAPEEAAPPTPPAAQVPLKERKVVPGRESALCFVGGHVDLLTAFNLACVDASTYLVLSPWLRTLRAAHVRADEPAKRLRLAAAAAASLPQLTELYVGGCALEVKRLKGEDKSGSSRTVLDLAACLGKANITRPQVAFAVTTVACTLAKGCTALRKVVAWRATEVDLVGRKLELGARNLGDAGFGAVCGVLAGMAGPRLANLREIDFHSNKLSDAAMVPLAAAVAGGGLSQARHLGLGDNRIGPAGARTLAEATAFDDKDPLAAIASRPLGTLTSLNLEGNVLCDEGVASLGSALGSGAMPSLEVLTLNRNMLTSADALTKAIASGEAPQLRRLLLQHNRISDQSLRELQTTVNASMLKAPQPTHAERPRASADPPTGVAVHIKRIFRRYDEERFVPAVRRGFPQKRDQGVQVRAKDLEEEEVQE